MQELARASHIDHLMPHMRLRILAQTISSLIIMSSDRQAVTWTFLNISTLEDAKSKKHRTKVKSHTSKVQHARNRNFSCQRQQYSAVPEQFTGNPDGELESDVILPESSTDYHNVVSCEDGATDIPHRSTHSTISRTITTCTTGCHYRVRNSRAGKT